MDVNQLNVVACCISQQATTFKHMNISELNADKIA